MINLKVSFSKLICIFISLYSINAFSEENELINIIEENWNSSQTISGRFHQELNDNNIISGNFYIQKPYKSNFTYDNGLENIITSKFFINIVDNKKFLIDRYPTVNQPIYKILSEEISFKEIFEILSIKIIDNEIAINLVSKNNSSDSKAKIKLAFNGDDYSLKNWEIIDDLGQSTYLEFTKIRKNISIDQEWFIIKQ
ncbi:outer membrane lipoprotein carrier protein LolA [Pelagibacterales bacterium]|nr:outer membrane lipoprotein carrier protein LolA [Pelagibacterales bacterium]